jgi:transposase, IS30 family
MQAKKLPIEGIARALGKHRSTIYREVKRNIFADQEWRECNGYFPVTAHDLARDRRRRQYRL